MIRQDISDNLNLLEKTIFLKKAFCPVTVNRVIGASCAGEYLYPSSSNLQYLIYNSLDMIYMVIYGSSGIVMGEKYDFPL